VIPVSYASKHALQGNPGEWKEIKNSTEVQSFFRWATNESGATFRERKGIINSNCSMDQAIHYVTNADLAKKWMTNLDENYNLKIIGKNEWYMYTLFDIPWPLNKRDMVSQYKVYSDSIKKETTIVITSLDQYMPLKQGISRIHKYRAVWNIKEKGEQVLITFYISSHSPPEFPRYIQDPIIDHVFHNNLIRLRELLETMRSK
jgi:hypothetical protein